MRQLRVLAQGVWYEIRTRINNREPLFRRANALALFAVVFRETKLRFVFDVRSLRLEDDRLTFYIRPEDGFELPDIMKWMKQVFAQRFNAAAGREGHIWGDRYWSRIVEGEPETEGRRRRTRPTGTDPVGEDQPTGTDPVGGERREMPVFPLFSPFPRHSHPDNRNSSVLSLT
jgi:REP element-mobilizing transposase RayT